MRSGSRQDQEGLVGLGEKVGFILSAAGKAFCKGVAVFVLWIILPSL